MKSPAKFVCNCKKSKADNLASLITLLKKTAPIPIKDLLFTDLMLPVGKCHGIYAFCEGGNYHLQICKGEKTSDESYWYIGKASGKCIVERIGAHFTPRQKDYGNTLLRHIAEVVCGSKDDASIAKVFDIMQDLSLKVIYFEEATDECERTCINELENELIKQLKPAFNWPKRMGRTFKIFDNNRAIIHR